LLFLQAIVLPPSHSFVPQIISYQITKTAAKAGFLKKFHIWRFGHFSRSFDAVKERDFLVFLHICAQILNPTPYKIFQK
jgi:hypothetical protein